MRRSARAKPSGTTAAALKFAWLVACGASGCGAESRAIPAPAAGGTWPPACPRDAARVGGRCACVQGTSALLGACVTPETGDAYCGVAARFGADGCAFKACGANEEVDLATGRCTPVARARPATFEAMDGGVGATDHAAACPEETAPWIADGWLVCEPRELGCPRGTERRGDACERHLRCPPGSLPQGDACRVIVAEPSARSGALGHRVDVGAWAALVLGVDGGPGSHELCRPLGQSAALLPAPAGPGLAAPLHLRIALRFPDEDLSRVAAEVDARDNRGVRPGGIGEQAVEGAVATLVEILRSLGGEANAASVVTEVWCDLGAARGVRGEGETLSGRVPRRADSARRYAAGSASGRNGATGTSRTSGNEVPNGFGAWLGR